MATRFRKTKKVGPARISVSKKSLGTSFGGKAFGISVNSKSGVRFRSSIPGTGISYTHKLGSSKKKGVNKATKATPKSTSAFPKIRIRKGADLSVFALFFSTFFALSVD